MQREGVGDGGTWPVKQPPSSSGGEGTRESLPRLDELGHGGQQEWAGGATAVGFGYLEKKQRGETSPPPFDL